MSMTLALKETGVEEYGLAVWVCVVVCKCVCVQRHDRQQLPFGDEARHGEVLAD